MRKGETEAARLRRMKAKTDFIEMLRGSKYVKAKSMYVWASQDPALRLFLLTQGCAFAHDARPTRWEDVKTRFESDARYRAVENSKDREDLFEDYLWELKRVDREQRKLNAAAFRQLLTEATHLNGRSRWVDEEVRCGEF